VKAAAVPFAVVTAVLAMTGTTGCAQQPPQACGGQCGPPYFMQVGFRAGTTRQQATAVLRGCSRYRGVVRVGSLDMSGGELTAEVWTTTLGGPVSMLNCLHRSPAFTGIGIPD
jgi:hypothetical protein